ncbi:unnamed protein product [Fraxinus pennsylvanica]|uniref:Uncharacterized protein n=1 Tax=Fraxinus pennsylvanica TaxID=56036 RepID=A0AAD1Z9M7_9LAMI|nr:unnamed protein product [Fraxinus pennsylvanica]
MGDKGRDIPMETQFLLLETKNGSSDNNEIVYTVVLPLVEGPIKASLQGNDKDEVELCLESRAIKTVGSVLGHSVYISAGTDPFETIHEAMMAVKLHLGTFRLRHEKKLPGIVDSFGWCTGMLSTTRLTGIKENEKFQNKVDHIAGMKNIIKFVKEKYSLKYVYIWHAIIGYWAGVQPEVKEMEEYGCFIEYLKLSKGVVENEQSHLASAGIDGVKVDGQCLLETLGNGLGGRVELISKYQQALDASVAKNFPDNECIACRSHNIDSFYCSKQTAIVRASEGFSPLKPISHTIYIASVAYNSVFLGEFMLPDWDMFHSLHPEAEYHGSAKAISGGPVYIRGDDVHLISEVALDSNWNGDCTVYSHRSGDLVTLSHNDDMLVSLKVLKHEIFTITPVKVLAPRFSFAPLGKGYEGEGNSNAEDRLRNLSIEVVALVSMKVKGCGRFGTYASAKLRKCRVGLSEVDFAYELASGLLRTNLLDMPHEDQKVHTVEIEL